MKYPLFSLAASVSFATFGALAPAMDVSGTTPTPRGCPDRKATAVDSEYIELGPQTACASGVKLKNGEVWVPSCPEKLTIVPWHGECHGEPNEGTRCMILGDLPVSTGTCSCDSVIFIGNWVVVGCTCSDFVASGTVENFGTQDCV
ncbi:MAG: hypothetical protein L6Q99_15175 [Planctomycetes bacterium]|nr:hypothetical protein [Planctomycetota bacterium]